MLYNYLGDDSSGDHWAVNSNGSCAVAPVVLAQLQYQGVQVRAALTPEQAESMAAELIKHAAAMRDGQPNPRS